MTDKPEVSEEMVTAALLAAGGRPESRDGMIAALGAAGLWNPAQPGRFNVAHSAYTVLGRVGEAQQPEAMRRALAAVAELAARSGKKMPATSAAKVELAVREYLDQLDDGVVEVQYAMYRDIADLARVDTALAGHAYDQQKAWDKFTGQVMRQLNKLAGEGTLRKAAAGSEGPDGREVHRGRTRFYTPEAWEERGRAADAERDRKAEIAARWGALYDRLSALGVASTNPRGGIIKLSSTDWEQLLGLAEGGMARHLASEDA